MSTQSNIIKSFNGCTIRINPDNQYVCLTDMAKAVGKQYQDWARLKSTSEYLERFSAVTGIPVSNASAGSSLLVVLQSAKYGDMQGTWAHPKIAIRFAQWCSVDFAIQVDFWIDELLSTGKVEIAPTQSPTPQRQLAPQRDLIDYMQVIERFEYLAQDPLIKSLVSQRLAEELGAKTPPSVVTQVILTVRAGELGYSQKQIGTGSQLGRFVSDRIQPLGKTRHGSYPVNVYELTEELDACIHAYLGR